VHLDDIRADVVSLGYTWSLSDAAVPAILEAKDEATMTHQWRIQYVRGFIVSVPHCLAGARSVAPEPRF
jgi:hypothetical protein